MASYWKDHFDNGSLDTDRFGTHTSGTASIVESGTALSVDEGTSVADASLIYLKANLDKTKTGVYRHKVQLVSTSAGGAVVFLSIWNKATAPACDTASNVNASVRSNLYQIENGQLWCWYRKTDGSYLYWDGSAWAASPAQAATTAITRWHEAILVHTATQFKWVVLDGSGTTELVHTDWVNWSDLYAPTDSLWLVWGEPFTDNYYTDYQSDWFSAALDHAAKAAYYNGLANNGSSYTEYQIGRALSLDDGRSFLRDPYAASVIQPSDFPGDSNITHAVWPHVILDGSTYYLWCCGLNSVSGKWELWCFTSSDGLTWSPSGTAPKISANGGGTPDVDGIIGVVGIKDTGDADPNKRWKFYYGGLNGAGNVVCCYAYAADPTDAAYTKYPSNPVLSGDVGEWDEKSVSPEDLLIDDGTLRLYYGGASIADAHTQGGEAISADWVTWTKVPANPVLTRLSAIKTTITTLSSGSRNATVASTSTFLAGDWVICFDSNWTHFQCNRVESIEDGSNLTLVYPADRVFSSGFLRHGHVGSSGVSALEKSGSTYRAWSTEFQHQDNTDMTLEIAGYAEGSAHDVLTFDRGEGNPPMPIGCWSWDKAVIQVGQGNLIGCSSENFALIDLPEEFVPSEILSRDLRGPIEARAGLSGPASRLPLESTRGMTRAFRMPLSFEIQITVSRDARIPISLDGGMSRTLYVPTEWDGAEELHRSVMVPVEFTRALALDVPVQIEWDAGNLHRAIYIPISFEGGVARGILEPIEWAGANMAARPVRMPIEMYCVLVRPVRAPVESAGTALSITHRRTIQRTLSERLPHERSIVPSASFPALRHTRYVKQLLGGRLPHARRILPQKAVTLYSEDIQLPVGSADKT